MKQTAVLILFFLCSLVLKAQLKNDSICTLEISLLTCAPGKDLYSIFGHTAIRVRDTVRGMDVVYNYGTFDDTDPLFYIHFTKGIMNYSLSAETMDSFMTEYEYEHRDVLEQVLNLNCTEKIRLYEALRENTLSENRIYQYHFHTDNCTTRAAKMIENHTGSVLRYKDILRVNSSPPSGAAGPGLSFRDMIHEYLNRQNASWSAFGIDVLLGKNLDHKVSNIEAIHFLPDYLYRGIDSAYLDNRHLVLSRSAVIKYSDGKTPKEGLTPLALFQCLLLATILLFIFKMSPAISKVLFILDLIFFSVLGLIGILIAYLWIARIDDVCRDNINILWALPTHSMAVFFMRKKARWIKYYFLASAAIAAILLAGFPWWPQRMSTAVIPILLIILFRAFTLFKNRDHAEKAAIQG